MDRWRSGTVAHGAVMLGRGPAYLLALFAAVGAIGPAPAAAGDPPDRETSVVVYGSDACPQPHDENEVVVCARRPEEERYRIPPALRHSRERRTEVAWSTTNAQLEQEQAYTRPNSCSPVGSFGQSGCAQQMLNQWYADRAARRR